MNKNPQSSLHFSDGKAAKDAGRLFMKDMEKLGRWLKKEFEEMGVI